MADNGPSGGFERGRLLFLGSIIVVAGAVVAQHLYWYQVAAHADLGARASVARERRSTLPAGRGALLDRNGRPLAVSVTYHSVEVLRPYIKDMEHTVAVLSDTLKMPRQEILQRINEARRHWTPVASNVSADVIARLEDASLPGVQARPVAVRDYPEGSLAAQVLGFVGFEGRGLSGLELTLDDELRGTPGMLVSERDTDGVEIALGRKLLVPAVRGSDVVLTLDRYIQRKAEQRLAEAVRENKATGGVIVIMEPATGALLAVASQPTYTLARDMTVDPKLQGLYKPTAVTDTYEPGSVMKLATIAAALEERAVNPDTRYFDSGEASVDGTRIYNWDHQGYGSVSVRQILIHSVNTGAQWVAAQLGADRFYRYLDAFGFGRRTGVLLNGEASGRFRRPGEPTWSRLDLATNSFGQSISVTPLQMITAVAALGNGGVRMQPQLVREFRGPKGTRSIGPQPAEQVVAPGTASIMLDLMVATWSQPALHAHRFPGYTLAGKSGTADIPDSGGYNLNRTYASFVLLGPVPHPRFAILVRLDQPATTWGGTAAAPVVRALAEDLVKYLGIPPSS